VNHFFDWFAGREPSRPGKTFESPGHLRQPRFLQGFLLPVAPRQSPAQCGPTKNSILISEDLAKSLFKTTQDGVGKTVTWNHVMFTGPFQVAGIFKNLPAHATTRFDVVFNYQLMLDHDSDAAGWNGSYAKTYVVVKEGTDLDALTKKITGVFKPGNRKIPPLICSCSGTRSNTCTATTKTACPPGAGSRT
jgi:hypothetical protein